MAQTTLPLPGETDTTAFDAARKRLLPALEAALQGVFDRRPVVPPDHLLLDPGAGVAPPVAGVRAPAPADAHYGMMRYHLGWLDERLAPTAAPIGKRLRPLLCLLTAEACGADPGPAIPAAVALELLHNFSLVHDDIEDNDTIRHHRPTVWTLWGQAQGINVGDGMHVLSYLALFPLTEYGLSAERVLRLIRQLAESSLIITEGQHLDLAFERRDDVTPADYLDMIARKSAALLSCATAAGAILAEAPPEWVTALTHYGHELGMGFQIRDDILGIWGRSETTGKPAGDLYRKKKTLPSLYALSRAAGDAAGPVRALYARDLPDDGDVARALTGLERSGARRHCETIVRRYCSDAREHLSVLPPSAARDALTALTYQMETRDA